jgi:8-oxo-dGTP pyrophosphatase MutT (NUDIX family)
MKPELAAFLRSYTPAARETELWGDGSLTLAITAYLGSELPPLEYVTSVRSLVLWADQVLLVRDPNGLHILPGGRRGTEETLEETLRREVLEETGWTLGEVALLGFMHFRHLGPRPVEYPYPYPDFLQVVYRSEAASFLPEARQTGLWELEAAFRPAAEVESLALSARERVYLNGRGATGGSCSPRVP